LYWALEWGEISQKKKRRMIKMISEKALENMERYGGSFVKKLAELYKVADGDNKKILEKNFERYFKKYENY
jgi:hypothetical protein